MTAFDESPVTFKASKEFSEWISKIAFDMDVSKSKLIRACIKSSIYNLKFNSFLIDLLDNAPINGNGKQ